MNKTFESLMNSVYQASENLSNAESVRDCFLEPILQVLGATGGGISSCRSYQGKVHIVRSGSCRGCGWDDDYTFPLEIFTCDDPLKAAAEYVSNNNKAKEDADRRNKLATVRRLQKELGEAA